MANGSMLGSVSRNSRVATNLTQSVDPVSVTTSTSSPSWAKRSRAGADPDARLGLGGRGGDEEDEALWSLAGALQ